MTPTAEAPDLLDERAVAAPEEQALFDEAAAAGDRLGRLHARPVRPSDSLSIRGEAERELVRSLSRRCRALPAERRAALPGLLNAVGKLQMAAGDFDGACADCKCAAAHAPKPGLQAEALFNAGQAALEARDWAGALALLRDAARLDPQRFAPFPLDKYQPERLLGAGGFGVAFLCRHAHTGGRVVVKALRPDVWGASPEGALREAAALEGMDHPAIVRLRECDFADAGRTRPYLVMDFFDAPTLEEHVRRNGPLTDADVAAVGRLVAEGLRAAHGRGVLHRDVKPANLLLRRDAAGWAVRLIDFGLAARPEALRSTSRAAGRTALGESIAGTLDYAAPEQMGRLPGVAVGPAADVYGWARTLCYARFGTPQPGPKQWQQVAETGLVDVLGDCLAEQPQQRPQSMDEVLRRWSDPGGAGARPAAPTAPAVESAWPREEEAAFQAAFAGGRVEDLLSYLRAHPRGENAGRAKAVLDEAAWQEACRAGTLEAHLGYLETVCGPLGGQGKHAAEARQWVDEAAWRGACQAGTHDAYTRYLDLSAKHLAGEGKHTAEAKQRLAARGDDQAWESARRQGTVEACRRYLQAYEKGRHVADALSCIDEIRWQAARHEGTEGAFRRYLSEQVAGAHRAEAEAAIDEPYWLTARQEGTVEAFECYLAGAWKIGHADEASASLDRLHWRAARREGTKEAFTRYLHTQVNGAHRGEAEAALDEMCWQAARREGTVDYYLWYLTEQAKGAHRDEAAAAVDDLRWQAARQEGTVEAYQRYLGGQENGRHTGEATTAIDEIRWSKAVRERTEAAFERYLQQQPDGAYRDEAAAAVDDLRWQAARQEGTVEAYQRYLDGQKTGRHAAEAREAIGEHHWALARLAARMPRQEGPSAATPLIGRRFVPWALAAAAGAAVGGCLAVLVARYLVGCLTTFPLLGALLGCGVWWFLEGPVRSLAGQGPTLLGPVCRRRWRFVLGVLLPLFALWGALALWLL
jgi:hypothetical protein